SRAVVQVHQRFSVHGLRKDWKLRTYILNVEHFAYLECFKFKQFLIEYFVQSERLKKSLTVNFNGFVNIFFHFFRPAFLVQIFIFIHSEACNYHSLSWNNDDVLSIQTTKIIMLDSRIVINPKPHSISPS